MAYYLKPIASQALYIPAVDSPLLKLHPEAQFVGGSGPPGPVVLPISDQEVLHAFCQELLKRPGLSCPHFGPHARTITVLAPCSLKAPLVVLVVSQLVRAEHTSRHWECCVSAAVRDYVLT